VIGCMVATTNVDTPKAGLHCVQSMRYPVRQLGVDRTSGGASVVHMKRAGHRANDPGSGQHDWSVPT